MRKCVAHKSKVPRPKVKVTIRSEVKLYQKLCCSETNQGNLIKLHRKVKHNEKLCPAQDLRFYAQGQGHRSEVKSRISYNSNTTEANDMKLHGKIEHNKKICRTQELGSCARGQGQNHVSAVPQKLLKQI